MFAGPHRPDTLARLSDRRLFRELAYIDGKWMAGTNGASFPVTDPATGAVIANVAPSTKATLRPPSTRAWLGFPRVARSLAA